LAIALAFAAPAAADEPEGVAVVIDAATDCPSHGALASALIGAGVRVPGPGERTDAAWRVRTSHQGSATALELFAPAGGAPVDRRTVASLDCGALASIFALIVSTHFTELGIVLEPPSTEPETLETPTVEPTPPPAAPLASAAPAARPTRLEIGVGADAGFSLEPVVPAYGVRVDVAWIPSSDRFVLRVGAEWVGYSEQNASAQLVSRTGVRPTVELGARLGDGPYLELLGGAFVEVTQVDTPEDPEQWRAHPGLFVEAGLVIAPSREIALRLDARPLVYLTHDFYEVRPVGLVARSPTFALLVGLSVVVAAELNP
jgi:hypothetical protein